MKVKIEGVIVSPDYDDGIFESWISKGVITPSSRVVRAVEDADEPIDLYINSYGGDVFAGGEMMIALLKAYAAGRIASVEVGSIAASMAANIVAALRANGCPVAANANSELMFHGCYTETIGGAQHHEDVAESLRNINDAVIANLNRIGITECRAWFAEGREKWIGATDGVEMGLFTSISDLTASNPADIKATATKLAALASSINTRKDYAMSIDDTIPTAAETVAETASEEVKATEEVNDTGSEEKPVEATSEAPAEAVSESDIEARVTALANARFAGLQAKHDQMISELKAKLAESVKGLASVTAERDQLKADVDRLTASHSEEVALLRAQLEAEKSAHESVVANVLSHVGPEHGERKNARETLASLPASKRAEFYKAHKAEIDR